MTKPKDSNRWGPSAEQLAAIRDLVVGEQEWANVQRRAGELGVRFNDRGDLIYWDDHLEAQTRYTGPLA